MSSEMIESERDTELRRMLVATASAAPVRARRRWTIAAPIAAFAVAGALTGAASAAALNPPEPVSTVNVAAFADEFVYDDTQLFGSPVLLSGEGDTVVQLGSVPTGAVELAVAFNCGDPGRFEFHLDGEWVGSVVCDETSTGAGGGGVYYAVSDAATHTLTISTDAGARYALWASWAARAVLPEPSQAQAEAMADGQVTEDEYRAGFNRYSECMTEAGYPLAFVDTTGTVIGYSNPSEAVTSGEEGRCYALEFGQIDPAWQVANE